MGFTFCVLASSSHEDALRCSFPFKLCATKWTGSAARKLLQTNRTEKFPAFVPWICRLHGVLVVSGIWKELTNAQQRFKTQISCSNQSKTISELKTRQTSSETVLEQQTQACSCMALWVLFSLLASLELRDAILQRKCIPLLVLTLLRVSTKAGQGFKRAVFRECTGSS